MKQLLKDSAKAIEVYIRELIAQGMLAPGQRVTEAELAEATGASRFRVRQAIQRLATEGILVVEEFRGASVKRLSSDEVIQLYEVREVLEGLAARLAAVFASASLKNSLSQLQEQMDAAQAAGDFRSFTQLNIRWHQTIIDGSNNAYVQTAMNRLNVPLSRIQGQFVLTPAEIADANADHKIITQAILSASASGAAERVMRKHIRSALKALGIARSRI